MFVWYEVWLIFLRTHGLNDCKLFHLRELIEFPWQICRPLLQELEKCKIGTLLKYVFIFIVRLYYVQKV